MSEGAVTPPWRNDVRVNIAINVSQAEKVPFTDKSSCNLGWCYGASDECKS